MTEKRAAIYCRVSKDEQAKKGYGLEIQEDACRQEAENITDNGARDKRQWQDPQETYTVMACKFFPESD